MAEIKYDIDSVATQIETATGIKMKLVNEFDPEYISLGQITEDDLVDLGFEFSGYSSYVKCPVYKLNNIEAIFDDTILHLYDLRSYI